MNAYYNSFSNSKRNVIGKDSNEIRKAFLANSRKNAVKSFFTSLAGNIDSSFIWTMLFALKIVSGVICAVGFLAVISLIESAEISSILGIVCAILIALLESLCFVPIGKRPAKRQK